MTDLPARIKPLASGYAGAVPSASDLERGELAINTADRRLYSKHGDDLIKEIGRTKIREMDDYVGLQVPPDGSVMIYDYAQGKWKDSQDYISLTDLKVEVAASTDFADFQARIAAL